MMWPARPERATRSVQSLDIRLSDISWVGGPSFPDQHHLLAKMRNGVAHCGGSSDDTIDLASRRKF